MNLKRLKILKNYNILAIESSCDETSVAIISNDKLLANLVSSQDFHTLYGGVVPELSSRAHIQQVLPLVRKALEQANLTLDDIDYFAATAGPGLIGALLVGFIFAKSLAFSKGKPFIPINHVEGHIFSGFLMEEKPEFPALVLAVSGGHTMLVLVKSFTEIKIIGSTIDDAVGEAFDKVAKMLGLGYPGGPAIQRNAALGDSAAINFPIAELKEKYAFSYSGLKTAVLRYIQNNAELFNDTKNELSTKLRCDIAASFQRAAVKALTKNAEKAIKEFKVKSLSVVGGVAANKHLREEAGKLSAKYKIKYVVPDFKYCGDNAGMIAFRAKSIIDSGVKINHDVEPFPSFKSDFIID